MSPVVESEEEYKDYDSKTIVTEKIIGNMYNYRKDELLIEEYRKCFIDIGENTEGNSWLVIIEVGKLVMYKWNIKRLNCI